jgi:uncharacterized protein
VPDGLEGSAVHELDRAFPRSEALPYGVRVDGTSVSVVLVVIVSVLLVTSGLRKQPGLGILGALVVIASVVAFRGGGLASLGLQFAGVAWGRTILLALLLGALIQVLFVTVVEPLAERLTGVPHDHSVVDGVRGSWRAFGLWMLVVWLIVAPLEEVIFRGFLMTEIARIVGSGPWAAGLNVVLTSVAFGLAHGYQGRSGILSTGFAGALLGVVFVASGYDLWLAIFTHGFIDTVGIGLVALGADKAVRRRSARVPD